MFYRALADVVLVLHLAFLLFVVAGGFLVLRWPRLAWLHVPAAVWGVLIEFTGWICPLTPLEQQLRLRAGDLGYRGGFIDHYITSWLYPAGLTRTTQFFLGIGVLVLNLVVYGVLLRRMRSREGTTQQQQPWALR